MITAQELDVVERARFAHQAEYHLGLIPALLRVMLGLAELAQETHIPVSRAASQFDRPQITGGGFYETVPRLTGNTRAAADAPYLWSMLADYAESVSAWLGANTHIPSACPKTPDAAHSAALILVGTLLKHTTEIWQHRELAQFEDEFFRDIRRMQHRYLPDDPGQPQHARTCTTCGTPAAVRIRWVDGPTGEPKPRQIGLCRVCGQEYTDSKGESDE